MARLISPASGNSVAAVAEETAEAVRPAAAEVVRGARRRLVLPQLVLPQLVLERVEPPRPVRLLRLVRRRLAQVAEPLPRLAADVAAADAADVVPLCAPHWPMESSLLRSSRSPAMPPASRRCCRGRRS